MICAERFSDCAISASLDLLDVMRQHRLELGQRLPRCGEVVVRLFQQAALLRERILVGLHVGPVLRLHLPVKLRRVARFPTQDRTG